MPKEHVIVLAHGVLGFAHVGLIHYFNGVRAHLRKRNPVITPTVDAVGSIDARGDQLARTILRETAADDRIHIIAHSMGGLDARRALAHSADVVARTASLVTIGTPHAGSPVADAVENPAHALSGFIPDWLDAQLRQVGPALHDLTTAGVAEFNARTARVDGIKYFAVAGDASRGGDELLLFKLAARIGNLTQEINDGVVYAEVRRSGRLQASG